MNDSRRNFIELNHISKDNDFKNNDFKDNDFINILIYFSVTLQNSWFFS